MLSTRRAILPLLLSACSRADSSARLHARPVAIPAQVMKPGVVPLSLRSGRDALVSVPATRRDPAPLLVYLHGATGNEQQGIRRFGPLTQELGVVLLSPASRDGTWDAIRSGYGPDVRFIDQALDKVFANYRIDSRKIGVCGFSDGASMALGLGLSNGDLFHQVLAFSPGFIPGNSLRNGSPSIFISHGTKDEILPIDTCSRSLVPELEKSGYRVRFHEFDGPHTVPTEIAREAVSSFLKG
ncbi:MAG: phospholipase [Acidobacteria bacterium]|nr:phospholipase [Acidobacteriota bacterium]